ncbi:MAG: FAD-dependent oxidoreductase, partial [Ekhidna sp.]|nr:FAD-dependent oxidoreductase [Ekhidna sp.]
MKVAIVGGGITGLTTALALKKRGIQSTVYEQAHEINEVGAGIWLQPNAMKVLEWLGLNKRIEEKGIILRKMEITNSKLIPIKKIKKEIVSDEYGNQTVAIHRGRLQRILQEEASSFGVLELGRKYVNHITQGSKSAIQFENLEVSADVVVGADGIRSQVRNSIGIESKYRNAKQVCCRGVAKMDLPDYLKYQGKEMWGNKRRFGFSRISKEEVYFFAVFNKELMPSNLEIGTLLSLFSEFHPIVNEIIAATKDLHTSELADLKRLDCWYKDHTCLLGDAGHATTPNMGQGACQGIEDAFYFSKELSQTNAGDPWTVAFGEFENRRRKKLTMW